MGTCAALTLWLSLASVHIGSDYPYNQVNPGLSMQCDQWEVGAYINSIGDLSGFYGWKGQWAMAGVVDGYDKPVVPYIAVFKDIGRAEVVISPFVEYGDLVGAVIALKIQIGGK